VEDCSGAAHSAINGSEGNRKVQLQLQAVFIFVRWVMKRPFYCYLNQNQEFLTSTGPTPNDIPPRDRSRLISRSVIPKATTPPDKT
jgi:hypothetical protein